MIENCVAIQACGVTHLFKGIMSEHRNLKVIIEKHPDGYVAYPLGMKGVVVGQGDSYEEALADVTSAIKFHIETFGSDILEEDSPIIEVFVAEAGAVI